MRLALSSDFDSRSKCLRDWLRHPRHCRAPCFSTQLCNAMPDWDHGRLESRNHCQTEIIEQNVALFLQFRLSVAFYPSFVRPTVVRKLPSHGNGNHKKLTDERRRRQHGHSTNCARGKKYYRGVKSVFPRLRDLGRRFGHAT